MSSSSDKNKMGIMMMLACACLWSIAGIFIKQINWNPFVITGFRSLIAAITVASFMLMTKQKFRFNKEVLINGIFEAALFFSFVGANKLTTSANAIVLQFTCPVFLMIMNALIYKNKVDKHDVMVSGATLLGIFFCFLDKMEGGYLLGNCIAVGSGVLNAAMYLAIGNADPKNKMSGMLCGHVIAAVIGIPVMFFTDNTVTSISIISIIILGIFQLGIPFILYITATSSCSPLACSLIAAAEPLLNPVWVAVFDGEIPGPLAIVGGIVVISAVTTWCVLGGSKR